MRGAPRGPRTVLFALLAAACGTMGGNAALNAGLGVGASAYQRSHGECYAVCQKGTMCDHRSGSCVPIPCGGECRADEKCKMTPIGEHCVPQQDFEMGLPIDAGLDAR
jgi:hypothetical protein